MVSVLLDLVVPAILVALGCVVFVKYKLMSQDKRHEKRKITKDMSRDMDVMDNPTFNMGGDSYDEEQPSAL